MEKENNEDIKENSEEQIQVVQEKKSSNSDKVLIIGIVFIILLIAIFFSVRYFYKPKVLTVDELNKENVQGKLGSEDGYMYNGVYSFVKSSGLWFFQLKSPSGKVLYNIPLHFGPKELEDIEIEGRVSKLFDSSHEVYITFDTSATELQYTALAVGELDQSLLTAFAKLPISACDKNETEACSNRPIITCENTNNTPVIYFKSNDTTKIIYRDNCAIVQGRGIEQVRAVDRMLLQWYGVMD